MRAINKAFPQHYEQADSTSQLSAEMQKASASFIYLRADRKMIKVMLHDIIYVESDRDYAKVHTNEGIIVTRQTIASVEAMLPEEQFARIHRSYIVSLEKLTAFTSETVLIANAELPVGRLYRNGFLKQQDS